MAEDHVAKFVEAYLKKKGFTQAHTAFQDEVQRNAKSIDIRSDPDLSALLRSLYQSEDSPARYYDEYARLRSWAYNSLDLYKHELLCVLYPVFIHCYMDLVSKGHIQRARDFLNIFREDHELLHSRDLQKLEGVLSPSHLEEMEFAHCLRHGKITIKLCQYSNELLLQYLHKTQSTMILGIINEHLNFRVSTGQPCSISDDADGVTVTGSNLDVVHEINKKEIHWGLLEGYLEESMDKAAGMHSDSEKATETKEGDTDEAKKRAIDSGKQPMVVKKSKKEKVPSTTSKVMRLEVNTTSTTPRVKPELPLPVMSTEVEHSILEDLRNRVQLSSVALPSISFYTFINTHNSLNCSSISHDGALVVGGFSDSSIKVWDMAKLGQHLAEQSGLQDESNTSSIDSIPCGDGGRSYMLFRGHSGPVYSTSFSPLGDFIISSSADATIRLWSTKLNANLVCYKGHNYPVWDVQFSPVGHYFASASHDRTARIWSMDRIQPLRIMAGHLSDVDCVGWHVNCNYIATGSCDKTVRLWDMLTGECVRIFIGHGGMILSLAMSPDGRYMASGDEDGTIMIWDLASGRCLTPLIGHNSCVWALNFSCEGSLLATGSADCSVKLWDVTTSTKVSRSEENKSGKANRLRSLKTLPTKCTPVCSLRFSRRNLLFAAGPLEKSN